MGNGPLSIDPHKLAKVIGPVARKAAIKASVVSLLARQLPAKDVSATVLNASKALSSKLGSSVMSVSGVRSAVGKLAKAAKGSEREGLGPDNKLGAAGGCVTAAARTSAKCVASSIY